jgi:glycosyltransferase involved in cell wall biosynthesis
MAKIGLNMIVKDESKLILRCLKSCLPLVDFVCISDTGSTDGTQVIIRDYLDENHVEGLVLDHPWSDFAHNRNLALESMRPFAAKGIDYVFVIDADDQLQIEPGFNIKAFKDSMDRDIYDVLVIHGSMNHWRPQIIRNSDAFRWVGVLHEYIEAPPTCTRLGVRELKILASIEGSRNADPEKFKKDADILEKAVKIEKNPYLFARYLFYLAQSYRDAKDDEKARRNYVECAKFPVWDQQVYISLLEAIRCCTRLGGEFEFDTAMKYFERAKAALPERAEVYHAMSFLCRQLGKNKEGMDIAKPALNFTVQEGGLFAEPWIYDYALRDEYAVNAYWTGAYKECLISCLKLLSSPKTPPDMIKRLSDNATAAAMKLFEADQDFIFSD